MNGLRYWLEPIGIIEPTSDHIGFEYFDLQKPFFGYGFVHQSPAKSSPMIARVKKQSADFIVDEGNETDDFAIHLHDPYFGEGCVDIPHIISLLV